MTTELNPVAACRHDSDAAISRADSARATLVADIEIGMVPEYLGIMMAICPDCDDFFSVGIVEGPKALSQSTGAMSQETR